MVVTDLYAGDEEFTPRAAQDFLAAKEHANGPKKAEYEDVLDHLRVIGGLCNSGEFDAAAMHLPLADRKIHGDATDQAILRLSESLGSVADLRQQWKKVFEIAFNSKNKFMARVMAPVEQSSTEQRYVEPTKQGERVRH